MAIPITVPRLGWSMEEGTFVEWLKRDGDAVRAGEPLYVLESEKASEPVEAIDSGMLRLTAESPKGGEVVKVGQTIAYFADAGDLPRPLAHGFAGERGRGEGDSVAPKAASIIENPDQGAMSTALDGHAATISTQSGGHGTRGVRTTATRQAASESPLTPTPLPPQSRGERGRIVTSPRARRAALELGVDLMSVQGTGRIGRIRERDVRAAAQASGGKLIPHSRIRKAIAARMVAGVTVAAPVTLHTRVEATELVRWRERVEPKPTITDLIVHATIAALADHPMLQAQWRDEGLWLPPHTNIAVAVDTETGLLAPVVQLAQLMTLNQRVQKLRQLIEAARAGKLAADEQRDATFTITNLGMYGVDEFTPIITLPQCAVLGIGRIADGKLTLSLTFDHRVVDGAPAARFLQTLCTLIARGEP